MTECLVIIILRLIEGAQERVSVRLYRILVGVGDGWRARPFDNDRLGSLITLIVLTHIFHKLLGGYLYSCPEGIFITQLRDLLGCYFLMVKFELSLRIGSG